MALTTDRIIQNLQAISGYDGVVDPDTCLFSSGMLDSIAMISSLPSSSRRPGSRFAPTR
ncbi:hypothetical protein ACFSLT_13180 [Novosphingobium resinovorum]